MIFLLFFVYLTCFACLVFHHCYLFVWVFSISDCMAIPVGWMFYFLMDWLFYDFEGGGRKVALAGQKKGGIWLECHLEAKKRRR
jgi:hypothetical protein